MTEYDFNTMSHNAITESMVNDEELKMTIADNMKAHGGSFVKALSECFYRADKTNVRKLTDAFIEYVIDYQPKRWK